MNSARNKYEVIDVKHCNGIEHTPIAYAMNGSSLSTSVMREFIEKYEMSGKIEMLKYYVNVVKDRSEKMYSVILMEILQ